MTDMILGILVALSTMFYIFHDSKPIVIYEEIKKEIAECEKELPRTQHCELVGFIIEPADTKNKN